MLSADSTHSSLRVTFKLMDTNILQAVRAGSLLAVKQLLEEGADPDHVDCEGNTALHLAVIGEHYNIAVLLLNSGADLDVCNSEGLDCLQLAQRLPARTVFCIAIQLTRRNRLEQGKLEQKQKLISQQESEESDDDVTVHLPSILQTTENSLTSARTLLTGLECQVSSARSLVNQLELEVARLRLDVERENRRKRSGNTAQGRDRRHIEIEDIDHCSICLEVPRPPLRVYQCPEGHSLCEVCRARPELTACPECRVSLAGVAIRNRTLERLIQLRYNS